MEEVTTTTILGHNSKMQNLTSRMPKSNEFSLPPIGENTGDSGNNPASLSLKQNLKFSVKTSRKDSGIDGDNGWSPVNSDNGNLIPDDTTVNYYDTQRSSLKKNITSSTLQSYGQSSMVSKHTNKSLSSKTSNNGNAESNLKKMMKLQKSNQQLNADVIERSKSPNADRSEDDYVLRPINRDHSNNSQLKMHRQNSMHKLNATENKQPTNGASTKQSKPVPKPRNNERSVSLQRQNTFMTSDSHDSAARKKHASNIKVRNSFNTTQAKPMRTSNTNIYTPRPTTTARVNNAKQPRNPQTSLQYKDEIKQLLEQHEQPIEDSAFNAQSLKQLQPKHEEQANEQLQQRIVKWLTDLNTTKRLVPTLNALSWNEMNDPKFVDLIKENMMTRIEDEDFNLSDFGSQDEQLAEYNRVVDKTYCFVHND